jgi:hypothetical protein
MRPSSPKKSRSSVTKVDRSSPSKNGNVGSFEEINPLQEIQSLQFQLGERDVEIERMKTTLMALNEKLAVVNDVKMDIEDHKKYFATSEQERAKLQDILVETSESVKQEAIKNKDKQEELIAEIERLQSQLRVQEAKFDSTVQSHQSAMEQLNKKHYDELQEKVRQIEFKEKEWSERWRDREEAHSTQLLVNSKLHAQEVAALNEKFNAELKKLDAEKTQRERDQLAKLKE